MRLLITLWWCGPFFFNAAEVGEATTTRSENYAAALAEADCRSDLEAYCADVAQVVKHVGVGEASCDLESEDGRRWWTCTIPCWGRCVDP